MPFTKIKRQQRQQHFEQSEPTAKSEDPSPMLLQRRYQNRHKRHKHTYFVKTAAHAARAFHEVQQLSSLPRHGNLLPLSY